MEQDPAEARARHRPLAQGSRRARAATRTRSWCASCRASCSAPDHTPDLEATLAGVPALVQAGASMVELFPAAFCRGPHDFEAFCTRLVALKGS